MASVYDLKPKFQQFLRPGVLLLHWLGITPNQVTMATLLGSFVAGILCLQSVNNRAWLLIIPAWLFIRMALNAIDGMLAHEYNQKSFVGAILNELGDVLSDTALYLPLLIVRIDAAWSIVLFVIGAILTEFCGVLGQTLGAKRHYEGPMGKSDRAFAIGLTALISFIFPGVMNYWAWIFGVVFLLTLLTCVNRVRNILKEFKNG